MTMTTGSVPELTVPAEFVNKTLDDDAVVAFNARAEAELKKLSAQELMSEPRVVSAIAALTNQDASFPEPYLSSTTHLLAQSPYSTSHQ